jgi:hypothetical protein
MVKKIAIVFLSVGILFGALGAFTFGFLAAHYQEVGVRPYLVLLYVLFIGYVSLPILVVGLFLWLFTKGGRLRRLAFVIPVLSLAFFTPFPEKCAIRGDVCLGEVIFPYKWEYWQYLSKSLNDAKFRQEAKWSSLGESVYVQEGYGDVLSAIQRTRQSGAKQY